MTYFKHFYLAFLSCTLIATFNTPSALASEEEKEEKSAKKIVSYSLKEYEEKFKKLLVSSKTPGTPANFEQYQKWKTRKKLKRNFVMYPMVSSKKQSLIIGPSKINLEKGDEILGFISLKTTVKDASKETVLPLLRNFVTKSGKEKLTLGDLLD